MSNIKQKRRLVTTRGLSGLDNIGNSCYMNSILQCLCSLDLFRSWIFGKKYQKPLEDNCANYLIDQIRKNYCLSESHPVTIKMSDLKKCCEETIIYRLAELFEKMWENNQTIVPKSFKKIVGYISEDFNNNMQQDSHEFMNFLLETIHEETETDVEVIFKNVPDPIKYYIKLKNEVDNRIKESSTDQEKKNLELYLKNYRIKHLDVAISGEAYLYWGHHIANSYSIITELFTGVYLSEIACTSCKNRSASFESFTHLSLSIPEKEETSLKECLDHFCKKEDLCGDNQYFCDNCNMKVDAIKNYYIWELPTILIVHLKRFKNNGIAISKVHTKVNFPLHDLDLYEYRSPLNRSTNQTYNLWAVSQHSGSCHFGHYIAYCKNSLNNGWYEFNDDDIYYVPDDKIEEKVVCEKSYILFYVQ